MDLEKLSGAFHTLAVPENMKHQFRRKLQEQKINSIEELVTVHVTNPCFLGELLGTILSIEEWESILFHCCDLLIPRRTDWTFAPDKLSSGSTAIDDLLHGGFTVGHTYDLCGEAGTGKSTLAMQTCLAVAARQRCAVYFAIEPFSHSRLIQLGEDLGGTPRTNGFLANFIVCQVSDWRTLHRRIHDVESMIRTRKERGTPVKLIVFDSIAALQAIALTDDALATSTGQSYRDLMGGIHKVASALKRMCASHQIALVFVNQVRSANGLTVPALGVSWANTVPTRLLLAKSASNQRRVSVVYSTYLPSGTASFHLENAGFRP